MNISGDVRDDAKQRIWKEFLLHLRFMDFWAKSVHNPNVGFLSYLEQSSMCPSMCNPKPTEISLAASGQTYWRFFSVFEKK